jgi:hypothetical protein
MAEKPSINPDCDLPEFRGPLGHEQPRNLDIAAHREEAPARGKFGIWRADEVAPQ